jgi:general secretion pathway protein C
MARMNTLQIRLLSFALFAVFCATLTYWIVVLTARAAPQQAAAVQASVSVDDAAAIFGGKLTRDANRDIKLVGILSLSEGAAAIIGVGDAPAQAMSLGSKITEGTKLSEVRARSIIIERNGAHSEIFLPPNPPGPTIYVR